MVNNPQQELLGLKTVFNYLCDGEMEVAKILYFIKSNYKEWEDIVIWLKRNKITGKKLIELFQNESPDGGGYHMGAIYILSRLEGKKHWVDNIKVDRLK